MILIDTNVLVALVDERDALRRSAVLDLQKARREALFTTRAVLSEVLFLLPEPFQRGRLRFLLSSLPVAELPGEQAPLDAVLDWLDSYAEHEPDFADAELAVLAARPGTRVWTYDREFRTTWRRPDGKRIPLVPERPARRVT